MHLSIAPQHPSPPWLGPTQGENEHISPGCAAKLASSHDTNLTTGAGGVRIRGAGGSDERPDLMDAPIVGQWDDRLGLKLVVEPDPHGARFEPVGILDGDPVGCRAKVVTDFKAGPVGRDPGIELEPIPAAVQPQDCLEDGHVEPGGRAGVPGPAPAADVGRAAVDVARDDVGLDLVAVDTLE